LQSLKDNEKKKTAEQNKTIQIKLKFELQQISLVLIHKASNIYVAHLGLAQTQINLEQ
jgi:hypothetical protein